MSSEIIERLAAIIEQRRAMDPSGSYVAGLLAADIDKVLKKVGEEATETVIAAKGGDTGQIVYETADLWFHTLVMLAHAGIEPEQVFAELERRFGVSGLQEKASRNPQG